MDHKAALAFDGLDIDALIRMNLRHGRLVRSRLEPAKKLIDLLLGPLQFDRHPPSIVKDGPGQTQSAGQPIDGGPKPHPLHATGDLNSLPFDQL
jgi:hypothetical protein